ncbi:GAF domain-containing protein [Allopusillimonas soli]|uniref:GAF domain-containing protein n=1 Tax=Allopusillimonas soli TaxID=659016 RepID=A0A853F688_9BURK|nr:GAF domain-containing protein [Allopusillimonas soli]NYT36075.1 GAF domain-containing protein [Allopusillimonas soli]TEA76412.1 GAF domain-containing protein [Allopusillimonas soli]
MFDSSTSIARIPLRNLDEVTRACANGDSHALFSAIDGCLREVLKQSLCTVNRYEARDERLTRLYSSDPSSYPVGNSKDKAGTAWGRHVLHERRLFIGQGVDDIRQSFDDHTTINALGLRSVINVPIVARHACLGTLNLLMRSEKVDSGMIQWAQLAGLLITPGFLFDALP